MRILILQSQNVFKLKTTSDVRFSEEHFTFLTITNQFFLNFFPVKREETEKISGNIFRIFLIQFNLLL